LGNFPLFSESFFIRIEQNKNKMGKILSKSATTDLELVKVIKTAKERDVERAFNELFKKYHDSMLFHFRGFINDEEVAQELVNEAFVKVSKKISTYRPEDGVFSTWLFKMTKNLFIDRLRKKREEAISLSDLAISDGENNLIEYDLKSDDNTPEAEMLLDERNEMIGRIINSMNRPVLKKVIKLRYFEGMSYEEITNETGLPEGTVKAFLFRARQELKKKFKQANIRL